MDIRLLRYFVALAEERSFTAAARRLHLSQPALSQQIQLWERRLGTTLVDRSVQPLRLTPAGEHLLTGAYRLLAAHDSLEQSVRAIGSGRAGGELRIGFVYGGLYDLLVTALRTLHAEHPGALLPTRQLGGDGQLAALRADQVDVVLYRRTHPESLDGLAHRHLFDDHLIAALPVAVGSGAGVGLSGSGMANRYAGIDYLPVEPTVTIAEISAVWNPGSRNGLLPPFLDALEAAMKQREC